MRRVRFVHARHDAVHDLPRIVAIYLEGRLSAPGDQSSSLLLPSTLERANHRGSYRDDPCVMLSCPGDRIDGCLGNLEALLKGKEVIDRFISGRREAGCVSQRRDLDSASQEIG